MATDAGESPEADEVGEQMDAASSRLNAAERDELRELSEQLYAFHAESGAAVTTA